MLRVTPHAGVWIEIISELYLLLSVVVTPRAGVWIEIVITGSGSLTSGVTPRAGVWIEIRGGIFKNWQRMSLPMQERALKFLRVRLILFLVPFLSFPYIWDSIFDTPEPVTYSTPHTVQFLAGSLEGRFLLFMLAAIRL